MQRRSFLAACAAFLGLTGTAMPDEIIPLATWPSHLDDTPDVTPKGTIFRCTDGHPVCEAIAPLEKHTLNWTAHIGAWRVPQPAIGDPWPTCTCGLPVVFWIKNGVVNGL